MFLWVDAGPMLGSGASQNSVTSSTWLASALEAGVCFVPGEAFAVDGGFATHLRLSFATASAEELEEAVERLAASLPTSTRNP